MLLENWKDIPLDKTVEEINREALDENATLPERKTWDYGQGYTRPFKAYGYQAYKTREIDTSDYISKLKFAESTKKFQRLQEGPGAGYSIYFYDIKLQNVKITKIWEDEYGVQYADFTAEIVPGKYDWSADGYDWAIGERNKEFYGDMTFYDKVEIKEGSTVEGSCENGYQAWSDPNSIWTEEDFIKEIQGEEYVLGELFGGGYIHSDIPDEYHMEDDIDCSDERSGYKNSYISIADLKLDAKIINQTIEDTRYYDDEDDEDYEEEEESLKSEGRLSERIHKIEHGNGIVGYAEPGEWEHLFFNRKPCGHITEDGEVYLCKDCPQEVYDAFSDYKLTKCSFLDSNVDDEDYDLHLATDDRQAGQWYESRRHPDPEKWKKGDWVIYKGKRYVTSMFLGGDMVKLENHEGSIVVPQSEVYKATKKDIYKESSVSKRFDQPICYVLKNKESGEYASFDVNNDIEWTKSLGEAESFDNRDAAWDFLEDEVLPTMSLYRGEEEEDWEYDERNLDYRDSLRYDTFTIEPVYRDSLNESVIREGKVRSERKDYPHGISKYTDYEDDKVKRSYYSFPYGFRSDRDDQEDWEKDLRYKNYIDYEKEASDWLDKNGDAWNDSYNAYTKSLKDYTNKVSSLQSASYETEEYKKIVADLRKARKYRDYAEGHGWFKTADQQSAKVKELEDQLKKYVYDYVKSNLDMKEPREEDDHYYTDFNNLYNTHRAKLESDIEDRKNKFAAAAQGKELFSGRDQNNDHHFYYKNGDKYRQIGSRKYIDQPFAYRGIYDYYESPDATQEFDDYKAEDIRFLEPVNDWNTKVRTRTVDSTD